ncbi:MAG TPA: hypothetical protein VHO29_20335 [Marmoricola sp.]|nr:hypothetical protein [Marmoricola sp.]
MSADDVETHGKHSDPHPEQEPRVGPESADPKVTDSDPSGSGPQRLAGGMGVSSERTGRVPGAEGEATHGAVDTHPPRPAEEDPPPEQSAGGEEVHPANDLPPHPFDPRTAQPHSHG